MDRHSHYMRKAIAVALGNRAAPFGAVLVDQDGDRIVAEGVNRTDLNPTWHGEIDVINRYSAVCAEPAWKRLELYTTAEPCPMCQAAILWAGIPRVIFGTSISRLQDLGWKQIDIAAEELVRRTPFAHCEILGGLLQNECDQLFCDAIENREHH